MSGKTLDAQNLHAAAAFMAEPVFRFVLSDLQGVGRNLTIYRGGLDGHYLLDAAMLTVNTFDDDPEGMRGLVPVGFVHMRVSPKTRPFRDPVIVAKDCPEGVVFGLLRTLVQLKMIADAP
jgi:hypothetical protein